MQMTRKEIAIILHILQEISLVAFTAIRQTTVKMVQVRIVISARVILSRAQRKVAIMLVDMLADC